MQRIGALVMHENGLLIDKNKYFINPFCFLNKQLKIFQISFSVK